MALTPEKIAEMDRITGFKTPTQSKSAGSSRAAEIRAKGQAAAASREPSFMDRVKESFKTRSDEGGEAIIAGREGKQTGVETAAQVLGAGGNLIGDVIGEGVKSAVRGASKAASSLSGLPGTKQAIGAIKSLPQTRILSAAAKKGAGLAKGAYEGTVEAISDIPAVQEFAQTEGSKRLERNVEAGQGLLNVLPLPKAGQVGSEAAAGLAKSATKAVAEDIAPAVKSLVSKSEQDIERTIVSKFEKGIKPSTAGTKSMSQIGKYRDDVVEAAKAIRDNKDAISLVDEAGEQVTGQTPKSIQQLGEAVDQTKRSIFSKYDALAKSSGESGAKVDVGDVASELDGVIGDKSLSITSPQTIEYAKSLKDRLVDQGTLDVKTAQDVVQQYNRNLEAFYKNPSYDNASKVAVDALVANRIRANLDALVESITGEGYKALKRQYGALKSIERDVVRAAARDARRNVKGLIDYSDILSGGQVVSGILSMNPATIASGLAQKGIASYIKFLNNPNRAIESMFKSVDRLPKS